MLAYATLVPINHHWRVKFPEHLAQLRKGEASPSHSSPRRSAFTSHRFVATRPELLSPRSMSSAAWLWRLA